MESKLYISAKFHEDLPIISRALPLWGLNRVLWPSFYLLPTSISLIHMSDWVNWFFNCPMSAWASPSLIDILKVLKPTKTHALFVLIHDVALFARHWLIDLLSLPRVVIIMVISLFLFIATGSTEDWEPEAKGREWCVNTRHQQVIKVNFIERSD